jgi:uncharacterized protein
MITYTILVAIFALLMLVGVAGIIMPMIPGIPYMFFVALIFGIIDKFTHLTGKNLILLGVIAVVALIVDHASGMLGAKLGGASKKSLLYGFVGLIIGIIVIPPFGGIAGLLVGVFVGEIINNKSHMDAFKAAGGSLLGALSGMLINGILAIVFFVAFLLFVI